VIIGSALTFAVVASSFAPSSATTVSVAPGETLLGIADEYGTTVTALEAANNLTDPNTIVAGSVLQLPRAADTPMNTVVVEPGQTISSMAAQYRTSASALTAMNHLADPNHVVIGSVLQVPRFGSATPAVRAAGTAGGSVVVQPGQTLSSVATSFDTTVAALASANNLVDPNNIVVGSVLRIPGPGSPALAATNAPGASGASVVVAAGDTLMGIAHQHGTTVNALATVNNLTDPNRVVMGSVLKIPRAGASAAGTLTSGTSGVTVTISPGQTLSSIAADHGTTAAMLEAVNGIVHPNLIVSGMQLRLPPASTSALASDIVPAGRALPGLLRAYPGRVVLRSLFVHWAVVEGVSPALLEAMCWWESGWQTYVSSVTGALGVCQLEPSTVANLQDQLGQRTLNPNVASDNIEMASVFLRQLLVATAGDVSMALAGYYQGLASVQSAGLFPSTKQYVQGILAYVPSFS
jgi:N-acetylmuramoyl-L-alanine amidase